MLDDLLQEYADEFGENFPIMIVRDMEESEAIKLIEKCIEENKPYQFEYDEKLIY